MTRQEITEFYRQHHRRLYNTAWRILRDSDDAEEVMQDTLLKYITRSEADRPALEPQIQAWLCKACVRASIDRLRERQRRDLFLKAYAQEEEETLPEEEVPASALNVAQIQKALDRLPEPYRLVVDMVLLEGLDYEEMAEITGKKEGTLRSLYSRGRAKLKNILTL